MIPSLASPGFYKLISSFITPHLFSPEPGIFYTTRDSWEQEDTIGEPDKHSWAVLVNKTALDLVVLRLLLIQTIKLTCAQEPCNWRRGTSLARLVEALREHQKRDWHLVQGGHHRHHVSPPSHPDPLSPPTCPGKTGTTCGPRPRRTECPRSGKVQTHLPGPS